MTGAGLGRLLALEPGEALAVVGAGGKTTVVNSLAEEHRNQRVLIMPTTKICAPANVPLNPPRPLPGIQAAGRLDPETGKLTAPPAESLERLARGYDLVLMEADGSRGLPCKGWLENEPVVPEFASRTLGVVTTRALGLAADESRVLRLPEFLALTGLEAGAPITLEALAAMVCADDGMFKGSWGRRVLLINAAEEPGRMAQAEALAQTLQKRYPECIERIYAGSARQNRWVPLG